MLKPEPGVVHAQARVAALGPPVALRAHQGAVRRTVYDLVPAPSGTSGRAVLELSAVAAEPPAARLAQRLELVAIPGALADKELDLRRELGRRGPDETA